jgi:perosamine synthetase
LSATARRHGIAVVEDAAQAIGAEQRGRRAGSFGDAGVFSFHGSKTLTTGEGGMLVTDRDDLYRRVLFLRDHGRAPGDKMFWNGEVAYKYRMSNMQAALGLAQLERVEELVQKKRQIFAWYRQSLGESDDITLNYESPAGRDAFWMTTVVLHRRLGIPKEDLIARLSLLGIDSRPFFYPHSSMPANRSHGDARRRNVAAYAVSPYGVNLPSALTVTQEQVEYVCRCVKQCLSARPRAA